MIDSNRDYAQVLGERDGTGSLTVRYIYGDDLISQHRGGRGSYYHYDGQMSARQLTDDNSSIDTDCNILAFLRRGPQHKLLRRLSGPWPSLSVSIRFDYLEFKSVLLKQLAPAWGLAGKNVGGQVAARVCGSMETSSAIGFRE